MPSFTYTGSMQTYTVPSGVYAIDVEIAGAEGYTTGIAPGGLGAIMRAIIPVTPGQQFEVRVGGAGTSTAGGFNGGGAGGGPGGGGASDLRPPSGSVTDRVLVAGAGGGAGTAGNDTQATAGNGGAAIGGGVPPGDSSWRGKYGKSYEGGTGGVSGGGTGTQSAGGAAANSACGGGGGGWWGGGGGGTGGSNRGGGGGGSSFVTSDSLWTEYLGATNTGHGYVEVTELAIASGVAPYATGGTEVEPGDGRRYHVFTSSGTLDVSVEGMADVFLVGAGGRSVFNNNSTARTGGGGGGEVTIGSVALVPGTLDITVAPTNTTLNSIGGSSEIQGLARANGGSPGGGHAAQGGSAGGPQRVTVTGRASAIKGHVSGAPSSSGNGYGAGGGGAGGPGGSPAGLETTGGIGLQAPPWVAALGYGSPAGWFGGGGAGAPGTAGVGTPQNGGGGANATNADANSGGGGGGHSGFSQQPGNGGSGIVIVRYRLPWTEFSVDLEGSGRLSADVEIIEPKTIISADLEGVGQLSTQVNTRFVPELQPKPIRKLIWVSGYDQVRRNVID